MAKPPTSFEPMWLKKNIIKHLCELVLNFVLLKIKKLIYKTYIMSDVATGKYWLYFLISTVILIAMLIFMNEWFWLALPFSLTYLVKALDVM